MRAKGIAVSQIILLVLGILVLAVVAYLLYSNFVTTGGTINSEQCRAAATRACTACSIAGGGNVVSCDATTYLAVGDYECVGRGYIIGPTAAGTDQATGKVNKVSGSIACSNYVGGGGAVCQSGQDCAGLSCSAGQTNTCPTGVQECTNGKYVACHK